jgi:hypothetical protein
VPRGLTGNLRDTVLRRPGEGTGRLRPITVRHRRTTAPLRPIMLRLHRVGTREVATPEVATQEVGTREAVIQEVATQEAVVAIRQAVEAAEAVVTRGAAGIPDTGDNAGAFAVTLNAAHQGGVCL